MSYSSLLGKVSDRLLELLSPLSELGVTVRHATDDTRDSGARRTAQCFVLVPSVAPSTSFSSKSAIQTSAGARANVKAYLICCGFELKGPKGVYWLLEQAELAVSGKTLVIGNCEVTVHCKGPQFTKSEAGFHQYRLELDLSVPVSITTDWRQA